MRFLWWKDGNIENELQEFRMCVYLFGAVCSPSCANFALKQIANDYQVKFDSITIDTVKNCFYVDDCLTSAPSVSAAKLLMAELKQLLKLGGFNLTKWASNNREVIQAVPLANRSKEWHNLNLSSDKLPRETALGLWWNAETDTLCFKVNVASKPATKRGILATINSLFDPLGLGPPALQPVKILLQDLCKLKLNWDEPIPFALEKKWSAWKTQLPLLTSFQTPRCYYPPQFAKGITQACIHHFSDASEKYYGYVSYLRLLNELGEIHCSFLIGKIKLTPMKTLTTPRRELYAATITLRLDEKLRAELNFPCPLKPSVFWTDSVSVLRYPQRIFGFSHIRC